MHQKDTTQLFLNLLIKFVETPIIIMQINANVISRLLKTSKKGQFNAKNHNRQY